MTGFGTYKTAILSPCGLYRYRLTREWDQPFKMLTFVMLNPSTADADIDDPTIRRCISFAKRDGFNGISVINLFGYRTPYPEEVCLVSDPYGPEYGKYVSRALDLAETARTPVVCARGAHKHIRAMRADERLLLDLKGRGMTPYCLGKTKDGHPRHPLYVRGDQPLETFA